MTKRKARAPNLDERRLARVVEVIGAMKQVPTWACVISALRDEFGVGYTRQALASHASVAAAYDARRRGKAGGRHRSERALREEEATRRRSEQLARVTRHLEVTREQMVRWAYNAFAHGMDAAMLDRQLPPKDGSKVPAGSKARTRDWRKRDRR